MNKSLVFTILILFLTSTVVTSFAYAQTPKGLPFDELWKTITQIQQKLVITQTNNQDTILQLKMADNPSNPPFIITNSNNENVFTVFPDGTLKLGAHSVVIDPDTGSSNGLKVGADNIPDNTIQSNHIGNGQIKGNHIGNKEIGKDHINDKAVGREKIEDKAVGHDQIDDKAIGKDKINDKAVGRGQIDDAAIGSEQLDEGSVTSFHILDGTITENDVTPNLFALRTDFDTLVDDLNVLQDQVDKKPLVTPIGTSVSSSPTLMLPDDGNIFQISGASEIVHIDPKEAGVVLVLEFQDNASGPGVIDCDDLTLTCNENTNLMLSRSLQYHHGDILVVYSDGTYWHEISRNVNSDDPITVECDVNSTSSFTVNPNGENIFVCHVQPSDLPQNWSGIGNALLVPPMDAIPPHLTINGYEIDDNDILFKVANSDSISHSLHNSPGWLVTLFEKTR